MLKLVILGGLVLLILIVAATTRLMPRGNTATRMPAPAPRRRPDRQAVTGHWRQSAKVPIAKG